MRLQKVAIVPLGCVGIMSGFVVQLPQRLHAALVNCFCSLKYASVSLSLILLNIIVSFSYVLQTTNKGFIYCVDYVY